VRETSTGHADRDEVEVAYERHFLALLRLAVLLSTRDNDGEDLVQEVFLSAADKIPSLPEDAWLPYLRAAVVNRWKNRRRREAIERAFRPDPTPQVPSVGDDLAMWDAISRLPARQRACLVLRYYEDLSVEETASLLECSPGTVKSQTSRGLERLSQEWNA
jgi:RNA polymerase sigma factor (sigma-70 family)